MKSMNLLPCRIQIVRIPFANFASLASFAGESGFHATPAKRIKLAKGLRAFPTQATNEAKIAKGQIQFIRSFGQAGRFRRTESSRLRA